MIVIRSYNTICNIICGHVDLNIDIESNIFICIYFSMRVCVLLSALLKAPRKRVFKLTPALFVEAVVPRL